MPESGLKVVSKEVKILVLESPSRLKCLLLALRGRVFLSLDCLSLGWNLFRKREISVLVESLLWVVVSFTLYSA